MGKFATRNFNNTGFTLAEVLITLGIIGVVAAMTIPTLMNKTNETEMKSAWKKDYSQVSQVYMQALSENGGTVQNVLGPRVGWYEDSNAILGIFAEKMKVAKYCSETDINGLAFTCWHPYSAGSQSVHDKSGALYPFFSGAYPAMILNDGTLIHLYGGNLDCSVTQYCGIMAIDVNGKKAPNVIGRDVYILKLFQSKLVPNGAIEPSGTITEPNTCDTTGFSCSAKYLYE